MNSKKSNTSKKVKHMTMMVIPHNHGRPVKNYCIPMWLIKFFIAVGLTSFLVVAFFIGGFFYLRYVADENKELKEINTAQAKEINELKGLASSMRDKLEALMKLDQEVRAKIGLTSAAQDEKSSRGATGSRSVDRYQFMTMGLGEAISSNLPGQQNGGQSNMQDNLPLVAPKIENDENELGPESVLELPKLEDEIDTLEDLKDQLAKMDELLTVQAQTMDKLNSDVDRQIAFEKAIPSAWPVQGRITSGFGWRKNPYSHRGSEFHDGIDIAAAYGTAIKAAGEGVVTFAGYKSGWGRLVIISHGFGFVSQYAHNSSLLVKEGDKVTRGQIIARLGSTGRSTGPHLHFGVARNGKWIDPLTVVKR